MAMSRDKYFELWARLFSRWFFGFVIAFGSSRWSRGSLAYAASYVKRGSLSHPVSLSSIATSPASFSASLQF